MDTKQFKIISYNANILIVSAALSINILDIDYFLNSYDNYLLANDLTDKEFDTMLLEQINNGWGSNLN